MSSRIIKLRVTLWLILAVIVGWLFYMGVVPDGRITYTSDGAGSYFIGKLTPDERAEPVENGRMRITGDPAYFSLRTPRSFDRAELTFLYKSALPTIETGVLVDKIIWRYDLRPLDNRIIDSLADSWSTIRDGETVLLQRRNEYDSLPGFLNNLPPRGKVALYHYDLTSEFVLPGYQADSGTHTMTYALRGPYQFYTYIKSEDLDFDFSFVDLNKNKDGDPVDLHLYYDNRLIDTRHLDDDGIAEDSGETSDSRQIRFHVADLPEGAYKIELRANDDIITQTISTTQTKLSFINKLWLADSGRENISLYTDGTQLHAQTINPSSLQTIQADGKALELDETYRQFSRILTGAVTAVSLEKDGVILSGNGVFAFSSENLMNPAFRKVDPLLDIDIAGIDYVLARYSPPAEYDGWREASAELDLTRAYREDGAYNIIISIPGLRADDDTEDYVEIHEIRVELTGKTLFEKLFNNR